MLLIYKEYIKNPKKQQLSSSNKKKEKKLFIPENLHHKWVVIVGWVYKDFLKRISL